MTIQEKFYLYSLDVPINDGGIFRAALWGLNTVGKHNKMLNKIAEAQESMQDVEVKVSRLCEENTFAAPWRKVVTRVDGGLADVRVEIECELTTLQTEANNDRDMLHAAVKDRTRLQLLLDAERKKGQNVESTTAD